MNELKKSLQWVNWKFKPTQGKVPQNPKTGGNAQSNNPSTWASYELAEKNLIKSQENQVSGQTAQYDGIGFMFANGICGIDIDKCEGDPERKKQAEEIIQLMDSYTEYSPSGNGYHIIFRCDISKLPVNGETEIIDIKTGEIKPRPMKLSPKYYAKNPHNGVECYFSGLTNRFFTYTGEAVNNRDIEDRTSQVLDFLEKYMRKKESPLQHGYAVEEKENILTVLTSKYPDILSIIRKSKNNKKFSSLFDAGDISSYNNDDSAADAALCQMLAFYCKGDFNEIDKLFRRSALYREKWERQDYRERTINGAIERQSQIGKFYSPKGGRPKKNCNPLDMIRPVDETKIKFINPLLDKRRYSFDHIGIGYLFADTYKNISRYVPETKSWYVYDGKVWRHDLEGVKVAQQSKDLIDYMLKCSAEVEDLQQRGVFLEFIVKISTNKGRKIMLDEAQSVYPISLLEFDKNPYIFNCQNCTLDLKNFTRHSHRANDFVTKISNVYFDPDAKCGRWESFIAEIMNGDMETAKFLQKALGYSLTGDISEECFFILYGKKTRNGKGTTMETTIHMLGDYGKTAQPETIMQKQSSSGGAPSEDIARLRGARFVNMSEPDKGLRLNDALVKQLTGGDTVTARFLHQNSFEYRPEYKLFINTNHLPKISDNSIFDSERVKLIPFERHFKQEERDKGLKDFFRQKENTSGIFNWFVAGLKLMQLEGLKQSKAVIDATNEYREFSDTIGQFVKECLEPYIDGKIKTKEIYAEYCHWCNDYGYSPKNQANLIEELRKKDMVKRHKLLGNIVFNYILKKDFPFSE